VSDDEQRQKSNRTYERIRVSLTPEVAKRYGCIISDVAKIEERLQAAVNAKNWRLATNLTARLAEIEANRKERNASDTPDQAFDLSAAPGLLGIDSAQVL
jgi:hypothetical protein